MIFNLHLREVLIYFFYQVWFHWLSGDLFFYFCLFRRDLTYMTPSLLHFLGVVHCRFLFLWVFFFDNFSVERNDDFDDCLFVCLWLRVSG